MDDYINSYDANQSALFDGYFREIFKIHQISIPMSIQSFIRFYCPYYSVYKMGFNQCGEPYNNSMKYTIDTNPCVKLKLFSSLLPHINNIYYNHIVLVIQTIKNEIFTTGFSDYNPSEIFNKNNNLNDNNNIEYIDVISKGVNADHFIFKTNKNELYGHDIRCNTYGEMGVYLYNIGDNIQLKNGEKGIITSLNKELITVRLTDNNQQYFAKRKDIKYLINTDNKKVSIKPITQFLTNNDTIMDIQCGHHYTLFLTNNGDIYCSGRQFNPSYGQYDIVYVDRRDVSFTPIKLQVVEKGAKNIKFTQICCGNSHNLMVDNYNNLWIFGNSSYGSMGLDGFYDDQTIITNPIQHPYFKENQINIVNISCGKYHSFISDNNGICYSFGYNMDGQTGNHVFSNTQSKPFKIDLFYNKNEGIKQIECGWWHSLVLTKNNNIYSVGNNQCNQVSVSISRSKINKFRQISKKNEMKINERSFIDKIIGLSLGTVIIVNENKKCPQKKKK